MAQYSAVFTTYGTQQLAKAIANNKPLTATHFAVGDGNGNAVTVSASQERLVNEKYRATVSAVSLDPRNNKQVIFELTIPEEIGGFYIREMGVFDANNKLVAYANCPESFKPTLASGSGKVQVMRMILLVASSNAVTLTVDDSVIFVTRGQLTPKDITANSANGFDNTGHSHAIDKASTTKAGIVQLTNDTGLDSENLGLTAKAGKVLAQGIAALRLALNNYIPNSKKSSRVDSDSTDDVATPKAVKAAYEKAVTAENLAKTKWTAQPAAENTAGILPISHKTDGTAKDKFASEFAVGEKADRNHKHEVSDIVDFNNSVTGLIKNVVRKTYQQTKQHKKKIKIRVRKGHGYVYEDGEETINIQTEGTMTVYPNGKIEQIIAFRNFSLTWFDVETNDNALHIPVQLWSSMPNKVDYVTVFLNKTKSGAQYASEAKEWILGWAEDIQEQIKDKVTIRAVRWTGGQDEPVDLIIKVEGY